MLQFKRFLVAITILISCLNAASVEALETALINQEKEVKRLSKIEKEYLELKGKEDARHIFFGITTEHIQGAAVGAVIIILI